MKLEQFISGVPEDLRIWLHERKPESLCQAASLADYYALAHKSNQRIIPGRSTVPSPTNSSRQLESSAANGQGQSQQSCPTNNLNQNGRSQTNARDDKKCFQYGKFGHLMYSCPETQGQATKPALSGMGHCTRCSKVTWNQGNQKYLRQSTLNGKSVQMLIDMGCTKIMVSSKYLNSNSLDHVNTKEILCVHGDKVCYPMAEVKLRLGQWSRTAKVVAAPDIPVPALLGTDI